MMPPSGCLLLFCLVQLMLYSCVADVSSLFLPLVSSRKTQHECLCMHMSQNGVTDAESLLAKADSSIGYCTTP